MKKLKIFQLTIIILFIIFIFFFFKPVNYTKEYEINNVIVKESYDKENDYYYFTLTYNDVTFDYLYSSSYKHNRTFIENIDIIEEENNFCLIPTGNTLEFVPLCMDNNQIVYYKNVNDKLKDLIPKKYLEETKNLNDTYKNINIYNRDYTYLLWNYKGFYYINNEEEKEIKLFNKELYNISLATYTDDYLVIADYDNEYTFDKIYRITLKDGSLKEYKLDYDLYFDSYFPGYTKNKLYIVDNKEELMYELNVNNGKIDKTKAKILNENEWEEVGIKSLINQDKKFKYQTNYNYELNNGIITLTYKDKEIKTIIDNDVTSIIRIKDDVIFYLKTDTLYAFEPLKGNIKLLNYFEWNFNYENMIYVN